MALIAIVEDCVGLSIGGLGIMGITQALQVL